MRSATTELRHCSSAYDGREQKEQLPQLVTEPLMQEA